MTHPSGLFHSCGLRTDGTVACWGTNDFGESSPPAGTFTQIDANERLTCGVETDGGVACWGLNNFGQGSAPPGTFTQVSVGVSHTCAVRTSGAVACWGRNLFGESSPLDLTPPEITPTVTGALGTGGWYTSDVALSWSVSDGESAIGSSAGCDPATVSADTAGQTFTCEAASQGGSASQSVTVKRDATAPAIAFAGDRSYGLLETVGVSCTASDSPAGIASDGCGAPLASGPAYGFGAGSHALSASATDNAGNTSSAASSFAVTVNSADLCTLTKRFGAGSSKYLGSKASVRKAVDLLVGAGCKLLTDIGPRFAPSRKATFINGYKRAVQGLVVPGWLTQAQANTLKGLADAL